MMKTFLSVVSALTLVFCLLISGGASAESTSPLEVSTLTPRYNERVTVTVMAPAGAAAVRVWNDGSGNSPEGGRTGRWEYFDREQNLRFLQVPIMCWDAGPWLVKASYTLDSSGPEDLPESAWTPLGQEITLNVGKMIGPMDPPDAHAVTQTVALGEPFRFVIDSLQGKGEWYFAELDRWEEPRWIQMENGYADYEAVAGVEQIYPTVHLTEGRYRLRLACEAVNYDQAYLGDQNETDLEFTVTGSSGDLPEAALYFAKDHALSFEQITFWAWAEGADGMRITVTKKDEDNWRNEIFRDGGLQRISWSSSDSGVYTFTLTAFTGDEEFRAELFVLTQTASAKLNPPVLNGVPHLIHAGEEITGSFDAVPHAQNYRLRLEYRPDDGQNEEIWQYEPDSSRTFTIPGALIHRSGHYVLQVHAHALDFDGGHLDYHFFVTEDLPESLSVQVRSESDILLHQNIPVAVTAPQGVTAVRLMSTSQGEWDYRVSANGTFEWTWGFHQGGEDILIAQGTTDPSVTEWLNSHGGMWDFDWNQVTWTVTSTPLSVTVIKYGDLDAPKITFPNGTSVERGQTLALTLEPVDNAYSYGVQIRRADDDSWQWLVDIDYPLNKTATLQIPTDALEAGSYMLHIDPRCYGWHGDSRGYEITVTQPASWTDEPVFRVSPTEIEANEYITYSVYAPGAEEVMICSGSMNNPWNRQPGESLADRSSLGWERTYQLMAYAFYPPDGEGEGEWVPIGDTIHVQVAAPHGNAEITVDAPVRKKPSDTWTVTLSCDFKGSEGDVMCFLTNEITGEETALACAETEASGAQRTFSCQIEPGSLGIGRYRLSVYALPYETGYGIGSAEAKVEISEGTIDAQLTVQPNPANIFEDVQISLRAPGATAVALYSNWNNMGWIYRAGDSLDEFQTAWSDGEAWFCGKYTTEEIDPNAAGFSWENVHWEGLSNTAHLTVRPPVAELEELNAVLESATVRRGQKLKLTILNQNPGLHVSYGARLVASGEEDTAYTWFAADEQQVIAIGTLEVPPGEYRLQVSANAVGCLPVITWMPVTVTEREGDLTTLTLPASLTTIEEEAFAGVAAERIVIPSGVATIESNAFSGCPNLTELVLPAGITFFAPDALGTSGPVYVYGQPGGAQEEYAETVRHLVFIPLC